MSNVFTGQVSYYACPKSIPISSSGLACKTQNWKIVSIFLVVKRGGISDAILEPYEFQSHFVEAYPELFRRTLFITKLTLLTVYSGTRHCSQQDVSRVNFHRDFLFIAETIVC